MVVSSPSIWYFMNYFVLDRIEEKDGCCWGYLGENFCEVFFPSSDDTENDLITLGYAKCDAPNTTETYLIRESDYAVLLP